MINNKIKLLIGSILILCNATEGMNIAYVSSSLYIRGTISGIAHSSSISSKMQSKLDTFEVRLKECEEEISLLCHRIYGLCDKIYKSRYLDGDCCYYVVKKVSKSCRNLLERYSIYHLLSKNHKSYYSFNCKNDDEKSLEEQVMTERNKLQHMFRQVLFLSEIAKYNSAYKKYECRYKIAIIDLAVRLISACECRASLSQR